MIGESVGGAAAIRSSHNNDRSVGQMQIVVVPGDFRIIPGCDLTEKNSNVCPARQLYRAGDARKVVGKNDAPSSERQELDAAKVRRKFVDFFLRHTGVA